MKQFSPGAAAALLLSAVTAAGSVSFLGPCVHEDGSFGACHYLIDRAVLVIRRKSYHSLMRAFIVFVQPAPVPVLDLQFFLFRLCYKLFNRAACAVRDHYLFDLTSAVYGCSHRVPAGYHIFGDAAIR